VAKEELQTSKGRTYSIPVVRVKRRFVMLSLMIGAVQTCFLLAWIRNWDYKTWLICTPTTFNGWIKT